MCIRDRSRKKYGGKAVGLAAGVFVSRHWGPLQVGGLGGAGAWARAEKCGGGGGIAAEVVSANAREEPHRDGVDKRQGRDEGAPDTGCFRSGLGRFCRAGCESMAAAGATPDREERLRGGGRPRYGH